MRSPLARAWLPDFVAGDAEIRYDSGMAAVRNVDVSSYLEGQRERSSAREAAERASAVECMRLLRGAVDRLAAEFGMTRLGVFGSVLAGRLRTDSDVDLFVDRIAPGRYFEAIVALEELLDRPVDLVDLSTAQPSLRDHIAAHGRVIHE